ncbi:alpha/beta fold hydrolase [Roseateles amylovorans]|uniref:Alpha/beta hydrolase n=1 Tax=Roseateles amylovorans TaxID=2978473 RepID=A0ABY6B1E0_9BURK|nr:alpha/beta hydrolase [Roseateles amylovorans]UXH78373.1 alpha/beta hydrolase [Roseateles amylovorans]
MTYYITARDGARIFYKDWGSGPPVVFSHGWPTNADSWESQMMFLSSRGLRTIAHDRRGHGRSTQTWDGNDLDSYADDLSTLLEVLDLRQAVLVGFAAGAAEVVRCVARHGLRRVAKLVLISGLLPLAVSADADTAAPLRSVLLDLQDRERDNRAALYAELAAGPQYGLNREGAVRPKGLVEKFLAQGLQASHRSAHACLGALTDTDLSADLKMLTVPTLLVQGDDDQIVPAGAGCADAAPLLRCASLRRYAQAPHGLIDTHKDRLNVELLAFISGNDK